MAQKDNSINDLCGMAHWAPMPERDTLTGGIGFVPPAVCQCFLFVLHVLRLQCSKDIPGGGDTLAEDKKPLLIKRYASRRLYNTETSDYVTLEDIASFIRSGREVQIVDLKSGDDLTRQYLLQIIAEHESRGESVLPTNVLNDLVRSYTTQATSAVPQFLAASFEMFRESQSKWMENMNKANPMSGVPGFEALQAQQEAFLKAMTGGMSGNWSGPASDEASAEAETPSESDDLDAIKTQLAELQKKLSKLGK
ncbi:polyhydroxyalkanoate synthesis repressor PhaR [Marivita geojedonensis]|nr:polyhydroxyalkanoate synthesis repressor PhaR [Marivita geojedonensis]